jgi:hypothetical protein
MLKTTKTETAPQPEIVFDNYLIVELSYSGNLRT